MRVGRVLYPVRALGPGERIGIWLQGCNKRCSGCANPELQTFDGKEIPTEMVIGMVRAALKDYNLTGISITGGEPVLQAGELVKLLDACDDLYSDVLLFTGYTIEELYAQQDTAINELLGHVSVLVDGTYQKELNRGELLRGSSNQKIHFLKEEVRDIYEDYMKTDKRIIDTFAAQDGIVNVGIHPDEGI